MEFGKHLGKGVWGLADKALPVVYGLGYVLLVIRVLPEEEFGNWTLLQEIFLLLSGLVTAFALNPLLKFAAEEPEESRETVTVAIGMQTGFTVLAAVVILGFRTEISAILHSYRLSALLAYLPAMLAASFARNLSLVLLQARFRVRELFFTDAVHFLGAPFLTWVWSRMHQFDAAMDLVYINIISLTCSSLLGIAFTWRSLYLTRRLSREVIRKIWNYGSFSLGGVVSSLFTGRADSFLLAAFTGPIEVAAYNSVKIFTRAYDMVSQVVQMFLLPAASQLSSRQEKSSLKIVVEKSLLFSAVGMVPVMAAFLFLAGPLVHIVYQGKYLEAVPQLQLFGLMALFVPATAIASSVLLGIGEARAGFVIGLEALTGSLVFYIILIPLFGVTGATGGYVLSAVLVAFLSLHRMIDHVPITSSEVMRRWRDISIFVQRSVGKLRGDSN
ncbi:MAG: oligosaccharide flippase family protein [Bacteroidota bacterium]